MYRKFLSLIIFSFYPLVHGINQEIEKAIINSESDKLFNLFSGIVSVPAKDREYYLKLAHEESTKALMGFNNFKLRRLTRLALGASNFAMGVAIALWSWFKFDKDDDDEIMKNGMRVLGGSGLIIAFLGAHEIYKAAIGIDLIKKCRKALAVESLVNRLQVSDTNS